MAVTLKGLAARALFDPRRGGPARSVRSVSDAWSRLKGDDQNGPGSHGTRAHHVNSDAFRSRCRCPRARVPAQCAAPFEGA